VCAWLVFLAQAKADHLSQPEKLTCRICAQTWSIVSSKPRALNKLWVADITYVRMKKGFGVGPMRTAGITAASSQSSDPSVRGTQEVLFTIRITARSTSALSTTSVSPSTGLPLPLGLSVTEMTMLWLKTLTAPHKRRTHP